MEESGGRGVRRREEEEGREVEGRRGKGGRADGRQ